MKPSAAAWSILPESAPAKGCRAVKHVSRFVFGFVLLTAICYSATHSARVKISIGTFLYWIQGLGTWGPVVLFGVYVVSVVLMIPTTLLNLGAGYCFGVWVGFPCILLASLSGASIAFLLGRTLARDCVSSCFGEYTQYLKRVDQGLLQSKGAFRFVFLSRVPPCMPFPIMNYLYGTTSVHSYTYVTATALGLCPGTFLYVYMGHALHSLVDLLSGDPAALSLHQQMMFVLGVVVTILVSLYLANEARIVGQRPLPTEAKLSRGDRRASVDTAAVAGMHTTDEDDEEVPAEDIALLVDYQGGEPQDAEGHEAMDAAELQVEEGFISWLATFDAHEFASALRKSWW